MELRSSVSTMDLSCVHRGRGGGDRGEEGEKGEGLDKGAARREENR